MYPPIKQFYDRTTAATLARGAAAAYGGGEKIRRWAMDLGCGECEIIGDSGTDTLAFAARGEDFAVVCFRGTADLRNWITDLDCRRGQWTMDNGQWITGMKVHEGFQRALGAVWVDLKAIVDRMATGRSWVWFTGHSLGGALAMLAAARWEGGTANLPGNARGFGESPKPTGESPVLPKAWVYTFGQPRVGNRAWARWYDRLLGSRSFRIIHADDIVARVPWLLQAYRHCGTEVFYPAGAVGRAGTPLPAAARTECAPYLIDAPWWRKAGSDAAGLYQEWRQGKIALLADHRVDTYVRLLGVTEGSRHGSTESSTFAEATADRRPTVEGIGAQRRRHTNH